MDGHSLIRDDAALHAAVKLLDEALDRWNRVPTDTEVPESLNDDDFWQRIAAFTGGRVRSDDDPA